MWRTDKVKPAPDSWGAVFDAELALQGQGHGLRQPDLHRRRGAVPEGDPARPGDRRTPTSSTTSSSRPPSTCSSSSARSSASTGRTTPRSRPRSPAATPWSARPGRSSPTCSRPTRCRSRRRCPKEGATGWSDTWMISVQGQAPELHVHVDGPHHLPEGQRRSGGVVRRGARRTRSRARETAVKNHCEIFHADDEDVLREGRVLDDADARSAVTTAERSARTTPSGSRPGRRSRAEPQPLLRAPAPPAAVAAARGAGRLAGHRLPRLAGRPVRRRLLAARHVHRPGRARLRPAELPDAGRATTSTARSSSARCGSPPR